MSIEQSLLSTEKKKFINPELNSKRQNNFPKQVWTNSSWVTLPSAFLKARHISRPNIYWSLKSPVHSPEDLPGAPLGRLGLGSHHVVDGLDDPRHLRDVNPSVAVHVIHPYKLQDMNLE